MTSATSKMTMEIPNELIAETPQRKQTCLNEGTEYRGPDINFCGKDGNYFAVGLQGECFRLDSNENGAITLNVKINESTYERMDCLQKSITKLIEEDGELKTTPLKDV